MSYSREKIDLVNELHAPARRNFPRRQVVVKGIADTYQADLIEMSKFSRQNAGNKFILCCIDVFSKYAWAFPLKNKTSKSVTDVFKKKILIEQVPKNLQTDQGKEFYNKEFQVLMLKYGINHYSTYSVLKASIVERFNRTLKEALWKQFSLQGNHKWVKILPQLVYRYNNTRLHTIE